MGLTKPTPRGMAHSIIASTNAWASVSLPWAAATAACTWRTENANSGKPMRLAQLVGLRRQLLGLSPLAGPEVVERDQYQRLNGRADRAGFASGAQATRHSACRHSERRSTLPAAKPTLRITVGSSSVVSSADRLVEQRTRLQLRSASGQRSRC